MSKTIYGASRTKHAETWRRLRDVNGYPIISSWIDEAGAGETASMEELWSRCIVEVKTADTLVLYVESEEDNPLKGGLVEVGAALALGKPVFVVGPVQGSWTAHPNVVIYGNLLAAVKAAYWS